MTNFTLCVSKSGSYILPSTGSNVPHSVEKVGTNLEIKGWKNLYNQFFYFFSNISKIFKKFKNFPNKKNIKIFKKIIETLPFTLRAFSCSQSSTSEFTRFHSEWSSRFKSAACWITDICVLASDRSSGFSTGDSICGLDMGLSIGEVIESPVGPNISLLIFLYNSNSVVTPLKLSGVWLLWLLSCGIVLSKWRRISPLWSPDDDDTSFNCEKLWCCMEVESGKLMSVKYKVYKLQLKQGLNLLTAVIQAEIPIWLVKILGLLSL